MTFLTSVANTKDSPGHSACFSVHSHVCQDQTTKLDGQLPCLAQSTSEKEECTMLNVVSDEMGQLNGTKPGPQGLWHAEADPVHCCEKPLAVGG